MRKAFETTSIRPGGKVHIGLDIGSISVNTVVIDSERRVLENYYDYCHGRPFHVLREVLTRLLSHLPVEAIGLVGLTGTGGKLASRLIGGSFVNEIVAQSSSVAELYPEAQTIIEMGGEDSKLIFLEQPGPGRAALRLRMNSICAAGTGSFLDQQARRINVTIEEEFGELALEVARPAADRRALQRLRQERHDPPPADCHAGSRHRRGPLLRRCAQFQEQPRPGQGSCEARGVPGRRRGERGDGAGVPRAVRPARRRADHPRPTTPPWAPSARCFTSSISRHPRRARGNFTGLDELDRHRCLRGGQRRRGPPRPARAADAAFDHRRRSRSLPPEGTACPCFSGVDVGSLSTNVVLIDGQNRSSPGATFRRRAGPSRRSSRACGRSARRCGRPGRGEGGGQPPARAGTSPATSSAPTDRERDHRPGHGGHRHRSAPWTRSSRSAGRTRSTSARERRGRGLRDEQGLRGGHRLVPRGAGGEARGEHRRGVRLAWPFPRAPGRAHGRPLHGLHGVGPQLPTSRRARAGRTSSRGWPTRSCRTTCRRSSGTSKIGREDLLPGRRGHNRPCVAAFEKVIGKPITVPPHFDVTGRHRRRDARPRRDAARGAHRFKGFELSRMPYAVDRFTCKHAPTSARSAG